MTLTRLTHGLLAHKYGSLRGNKKKGKKGAICHEPNGKSKTTSTPRVASRCNRTPQVCRAPGGYISAGRCLSETVPLRWLLPAAYILCIHITLRSTWAQDAAGSGRTDPSGKLPAVLELVTCEFQGFPTGVMHADINLRCASKGGIPPVCRVDLNS